MKLRRWSSFVELARLRLRRINMAGLRQINVDKIKKPGKEAKPGLVRIYLLGTLNA
jgi:hypothetical protein